MKVFFAALLCTVAAPAFAQSISVETTNFMGGPDYVDVTFALTNASGTSFRFVVVECTFFGEDDRALLVDKQIVSNVPSGKTVHDTLRSRRIEGVNEAGCRVGSTTR